MPTFLPAEPYPKRANDNIRSSDWNSAIDEVIRLSDATQYLGRDTFKGPLTVQGALTVTGDATVSGKLTVNGTALSELKGPVTVSGLLTAGAGLTVNGVLLTANKGLTVTGGLLTASAGLTVTGDATVSGKLTVNGTALSELKGPVTIGGLLTASGGINGPLTINGNLTVAGALTVNSGLTLSGALTVGSPLTIGSSTSGGGMLQIGSQTRISQQNSGSWFGLGLNLQASQDGNWSLVNPSQAGVNFHMGVASAAGKQFRFAYREANSSTDQHLATIGTEGLAVSGGIVGPISVKGNLTVTGELTVTGLLRANGGINGGTGVRGNFKVDSILEVDSITRISQHPNYWAVFGANMYSSGSTFRLVNSNVKGANIHMSGQDGGTTEFRFALMDPGQNQRNIALIGREGITSSPNGSELRRVATGPEFIYIIRGKVEANGAGSVGTGFSARKVSTGLYQIDFNPPFSNWPIVVATQMGGEGSNTNDNALVVGIGFEWARVKVGNNSGSASDRAFCFIAMGPRN